MKKLNFTILLLCLSTSPAFGYTIAWDAPTTNADGTPLTDLAGYKLYSCNGNVPTCSKATGTASPLIAKSILSYTPTDQTTVKTWFLTAVDTNGNESVESDTALGPPPDTKPPSAPKNFRIVP